MVFAQPDNFFSRGYSFKKKKKILIINRIISEREVENARDYQGKIDRPSFLSFQYKLFILV